MLSAITGVAVVLLMATTSHAELRSAVSQYGITWTFDKSYETGQFVTGDWWVVGPVKVVSVSPAPGPPVEPEDYAVAGNQFGDAALRVDDRLRNGSMVVLEQRGSQGYDSRVINYDPSLSIAFPYTLNTNRTLISTDSLAQTVDNPNFMVEHFKGTSVVLRAAAVLTSLASPPPADAFRPAYAGTEKRIYRTSQLRRHLLPKLSTVPAQPDFDRYERYFERPWIDHMKHWTIERLAPRENSPHYGREYARITSMGSLLLLLDVTNEQKEKLLIRYVQLGIDLAGVASVGGTWPGEGGHWSGRKWPIVFASILLGDDSILPDPASASTRFSEDQQTYYGLSYKGDTALFQIGVHHGQLPPYEEKDPSQWSDRDRRSESYRNCCTSLAWIGTALAARHMRAKEAWGHDAFFDYADRWMSQDGEMWDSFVVQMYERHRSAAPAATSATTNLKWVWTDGGKWVVDTSAPKPEVGGPPLPPIQLP